MDTSAAALATSALSVLAPALPYLVKAGEGAASDAGKRTLGAAWDTALALWNAVRQKAPAEPMLGAAVAEVEQAPQDTANQGFLEVQLRKALDADPAFAARLQPLVQDAASTLGQTAIGKNINQIGGAVSNSDIQIGDRSGDDERRPDQARRSAP